MAELPLITEAPGVDLSFFSDNSRVVISSWNIYNFLSEQSLNKDRFMSIFESTCSKLSVGVVAPDINLALIIECHGEVDTRWYFSDVLKR